APAAERRPSLIARMKARIALWREAASRIDAPVAPRREPQFESEEGEEEEDFARGPRRAATVDRPQQRRRMAPARQATLDLGMAGEHLLPPLDLLKELPPVRAAAVNEDALQQNARLLETVLEDFGVRGQLVKVRPGP